MAIDKMGKNKAASIDEFMDIIFQVREMKNMERRFKKSKLIINNWKEINFKKCEVQED